MALYAFDESGTRQRPAKILTTGTPTSCGFVTRTRRTPARSSSMSPGSGPGTSFVGRALGGVFGLGELPRIQEAYAHLCEAWAAGDRAIDIVGFSRGAATTLDFCHYLQERGHPEAGTQEVVEPNPEIRFLGIWDVVAAFGLANLGSEVLNIGHHLTLPKSNLKYCFHALATRRAPSLVSPHAAARRMRSVVPRCPLRCGWRQR